MRIWLASVLLIPLAIQAGHWSLEPVRRPSLPALGQAQQPANAIDAFVLAKLAEAGLDPSRLAKRPVLIRRLHLILLGIHPSPAEVASFVNDSRPDAWERRVDRVLDDPRLGERWAQHQSEQSSRVAGAQPAPTEARREATGGLVDEFILAVCVGLQFLDF